MGRHGRQGLFLRRICGRNPFNKPTPEAFLRKIIGRVLFAKPGESL